MCTVRPYVEQLISSIAKLHEYMRKLLDSTNYFHCCACWGRDVLNCDLQDVSETANDTE